MARAILEDAAHELARAIAAVYPKLGISAVPLVITGGTILHGSYLQKAFRRGCETDRLTFTEIRYVEQPAEGALKLASQLLFD